MAVIPNSCRECNQHDCINHQFEWFMKNNPNINNVNSVSPACPLLKDVSQEPTTKNDLGVDCISRQAAITFVCKNTKEILKDTLSLEVKLSDDYLYENVVKIMRNPKVLTSVTPQEPRKGHWIVVEELHGEWEGIKKYACNKCGEKVGVFKSNYCPNCGTDMREVGNE